MDAPIKADAEAAWADLLQVVQDFPFASEPSPECHRAAWLAFLLTLAGRFAVDGPTPFALVDAPSQASGKGLLVKVTSLIALGCIAPVMQASNDDEELRKAILPVLNSGARLGWLDDVANPFGGRVWNAVITAWPEYSDRLLGQSAQLRVPTSTVWAITGNNLSLRGDSTRRALHIRLEPACERPEDRGNFHHADLVGWVQVHQPRLLAAALTILRAFHAAGSPASGLNPAGSFEAWSKTVRDCVYWLTGQDATATQRALGAVGDESRLALAGLWSACAKHFPSCAFTSDGLLKALETDPEAQASAETLKRGPGELNAKSLGRLLRAHRGTIAEGLRLDSEQSNRRTLYRISQVAVSAVSAVSDRQRQGIPESDPFPLASGDGLVRGEL
jgi:putative DNA primase/helicase